MPIIVAPNVLIIVLLSELLNSLTPNTAASIVFVVEAQNVEIASRLFGGIAEDGEL